LQDYTFVTGDFLTQTSDLSITPAARYRKRGDTHNLSHLSHEEDTFWRKQISHIYGYAGRATSVRRSRDQKQCSAMLTRSSSKLSAPSIERILAGQKPLDCFAGFSRKPKEYFGSNLATSLLVP
jgi:hypothetical protein